MKSVDRDYFLKTDGEASWILASYVMVALVALVLFPRVWHEVHLQGLSFSTVLRMVTLPVIYVVPLVSSLRFRRYTRRALKENLVSERVAHNCEFFIGNQLFLVYLAIMSLAAWN